jgi:hypothetical protein
MRIVGPSPLQGTSAKRGASSASGGSNFASSLSGEMPVAANTAPTNVATVENIFLLQEVSEDPQGRRRRAAARGDALLDKLDKLRVGLLTGVMSRGQLQEMRNMMRQSDHSDDPKLAGILSDIELRVAVELAKLDSAV